MTEDPLSACRERLLTHLAAIYPRHDIERLAEQLLLAMRLNQACASPPMPPQVIDQHDVALITYGDSIQRDNERSLVTLHGFLRRHLGDALSTVHILPFFPWSSDDGFAVINYAQVNESLGDWADIEAIAGDYRLMADLVINHCSSRSLWFENFKLGERPGVDYFVSASPEDDLSEVVRPRTSPLLREVQTADGIKHVWCTFGPDQVDLNFANPEMLLEMMGIVRLYLDHGVRLFRLDAVAFLWKEAGTPCINLPQTHELVRLMRTLIESAVPDALVITETNIPNRENLAYFGNGNEAHAIYNFSLPPLLLNSLLTGDCSHLKQWLMSMPPALPGSFYFNFIASHDGIGLRPAEGLLDEDEIDRLLNAMQQFGGRISWRALADGRNRPYEINISLFDALQGTLDGPDRWQLERFICAHAIMLVLEGMPAFYIHSLLGTQNDYKRLEHSNHNRHINRHQWQADALESVLNDTGSHHRRVLDRLKRLIAIRQQQPAFHPNATQFTLQIGDAVFGIWRQSLDRRQSIFALANVSAEPQAVPLNQLNLIDTDDWFDLLAPGQALQRHGEIQLAPYQNAWISNG